MNIDDAYARQTIKRSMMETGKFNHLVTKVVDKGHGYDLQALSPDLDSSTITELAAKLPRNELFDMLNQIHIVLQFYHIHENTDYIYKLFNISGGYSKQILAAANNLAEQTKYTGYTMPPDHNDRFNRQFQNFKVEPMLTQNYFSTQAFREMVARLAQLIEKQQYTMKDIHGIWLAHYHTKYELVVRFDELKSGRLQQLVGSLGLVFTVEDIADRNNAKLGEYGDRRVKLKWQQESRNSFNGKFNYLMFLCGVHFGYLEAKLAVKKEEPRYENIGGLVFKRA